MASSIFTRKKQFFAPEVDGLIKQLTGFEENDRNYQEVQRFIFSNIIHHNFATVDIIQIKNTVDGYIEKFKAHGLNSRAQKFRELVDKYVASDSSQHTQLNVQWHVLWLLLNLSTKPISVPEEDLEIEESPEFYVQEDDINWAKYLREGIEEFELPLDDSEDDLDWLSSSEKDDEESLENDDREVKGIEESTGKQVRGFGNVPHPSLWQPGPRRLSQHETLRRVIRDAMQAKQWLTDHVQHSWWSDTTCRSVPFSRLPEARVCEIWEESQRSRDDSFDRDFQTTVLSEFKVIHEVLWMLQVPTETNIFHQDEFGQFQVKHGVSIPSTFPETSSLYLAQFCPYINMVNCLRSFEGILYKQESGNHPPPVTYKAYGAALCRQLHKFTSAVVNIETRLNRQDETMTLVSVMEDLSPDLKVLQYLHCIHVKAVIDWAAHPAWFCATRLLSILYEIVCEASDEKLLEVSLDIFIHSFHPYLDIIDIWLSEGRLDDWRKEFLVIKEDNGVPEVMPYESEMLKCGVTPVVLLTKLVRVVREAGTTMEIVSSLNKLTQFRDTIRNKGCLFKEFSENVFNEIKRLKEKISESAESGKEKIDGVLLKEKMVTTPDIGIEKIDGEERDTSIEKAPESEKEKNVCLSAKSSYVSVNSSLDNLLEEGTEKCLIIDNAEPKPQQETLSTNSLIKTTNVPLHLLSLSGKAMYDQTMSVLLQNPLLGEVFQSYLTPPAPLVDLTCTSDDTNNTTDYSISLVGLMSIHSVLEKQLSLVEMRHKTASRLVTNTLLTEYKLRSYFTVLRNIYFMENGNLAQSFYSYLFKEIKEGTWNNLMSLSAKLKDCVEEYFPGFENLFTVQIKIPKGEKVGSQSVHQVIAATSLAFKVDWPVSLVISEESIESYNKVFRFLLLIKYAFWTLRNTRFCDLAKSGHVLWVRRLHVLKTWMLHSTNTLHSYFMGLVLRSFSIHLEDSVQSADSLQVIVQAHNRFLNEMKIHCLQDKPNTVEKFIKKLLKLCSSLGDLWETEAAGGGDCMEAELAVLEEAFLSTYRGLAHCLEVVTPEDDVGNFLYELKCEIASSEPDFFTCESLAQPHPR